MKRWMLVGGLGGFFALALIATAPATLLDAKLQDASDGRLRLAEARGTLWSGEGLIEIRDERGRSGLAKPVTWRFLPFALMRARLAYEVELDRGSRPFPVALTWSGIELADADISLPAMALGQAVPKLAALGLTGDMHLQIPEFVIGRSAVRGNATMQWRNAGSALSPVSPLGGYELRISAEGSAIRTVLHTLQGPLQLDGNGTWINGGQSGFHAIARMPAELQSQLAPFLRLIAVERDDGSFELQLK
ncbi:MAG: type II secretion system protein N [Thermomonas sp.]